MSGLAEKSVLIVGAGGLGSPAALVLAKSGVGRLTVVDDDRVELSNLHRQVLFGDDDVGQDKASVAAERLAALGVQAEAVRARFTPSTAERLTADHDLVFEGADNFATKFLAADVCARTQTRLVSSGAVRWSGWSLGFAPGAGRACLWCVFEDIPSGRVDTCAAAGVVGPVVGVVGALGAALALRLLADDAEAPGELWSYDALRGRARARRLEARPDCPNCAGRPIEVTPERYAPPPL